MKQLRGFKYRFFPTSAQQLELAQTFGCTRYIYNWALALRTNSYYQDNVHLTYTDTSNALTKFKKDPGKAWLKEVSSVPLQQGLRHLNTAFNNFFAGRSKYPKFKKKNNRQSAHYATNAFKWEDGKLTLAKMSQPLKIRWSRYFTGEPKSVTISKDPSNRYFVSFLVEEELEQWERGKDFLHKLSSKLVSESQAIDTETLAVKNMMANHKLAKAIADCGWGEFLRQLEYKCKWYGRKLRAIDRWFPSTKRCHPCGYVLEKLSLSMREWTCPKCSSLNLRDYNSSLNILAVGQTVLRCDPAEVSSAKERAPRQASGLSSGGDGSLTDLVNLG